MSSDDNILCRFILACCLGLPDDVRRIIEKSPQVFDDEEWSLCDHVHRLLYSGNPINIGFLVACSKGKIEVADYLINICGADYYRGFEISCACNKLEMYKYLMSNYPNVNIGDNYAIAVKRGCSDIVKFFDEAHVEIPSILPQPRSIWDMVFSFNVGELDAACETSKSSGAICAETSGIYEIKAIWCVVTPPGSNELDATCAKASGVSQSEANQDTMSDADELDITHETSKYLLALCGWIKLFHLHGY